MNINNKLINGAMKTTKTNTTEPHEHTFIPDDFHFSDIDEQVPTDGKNNENGLQIVNTQYENVDFSAICVFNFAVLTIRRWFSTIYNQAKIMVIGNLVK